MLSKRFLWPMWCKFKFVQYSIPARSLSSLYGQIKGTNDFNSGLKITVDRSSFSTDKLPNLEEEHNSSFFSQTADKFKVVTVEEQLEEAKNVETYFEASIFIRMLFFKLSHFNRTNINQIMNDKRLQNVLKFIDVKNPDIEDSVWMMLIQSFLKLKLQEFYLVDDIELHLLSKMDKMSTKDILSLYQVYKFNKASITNYRVQMFKHMVNSLRPRCVNLDDPRHVVSAMYMFLDIKDTETLKQLEEKLISDVQKLKAADLCRVLYIVGQTQRRNEILIKSIVGQLNTFSSLGLQLSQLAKCLYSCGVLNVYDENLLNRICEEIKSILDQEDKSRQSCLTQIVVSLGRLRWKDTDLLDACLGRMSIENVTVDFNIMRVVRSLAWLNYKEGFEKYIINLKFKKYLSIEPYDWLEFVWCLLVLQKTSNIYLASVLNTEFLIQFGSMDKTDQQYRKMLSYQKLQNIETAVNYEKANDKYDGFHLPEHYRIQLPKELLSCEKGLKDVLLTALDKMVPLDRYVNITDSPGGHSVEAILYVDQNGRPQELKSFLQDKEKKLHRICIKVQSFSDTTLNNVGPTGMMSMAKRHLNLMGFKVIIIPYQVLSNKPTVISIVNYIKQGIETAIA